MLAWTANGALPPIDGLPWGAVLYGFHGEMELAAKCVFLDGNTFEDAKVGGRDAIWVSGPHELDLVTHDGTYARYLVTGNVLVWESDGIVLRLETSLGPSGGGPDRGEHLHLIGPRRSGTTSAPGV